MLLWYGVLDEPTEADRGNFEPRRVEGDIKLEHVSFSYPSKDKPVLRDISFHIEAGKTSVKMN